VTSAEIEREAHDRGYLFFTTHVSDPLPAAVGNVVLDVLARDGLDRRAQHLGSLLYKGLDEIASNHEVVADVRGRGLLVGLELACDELGRRVTRRGLELGCT
jgi:2,2-dialkylglycine decarboxylase (pyruvate)